MHTVAVHMECGVCCEDFSAEGHAPAALRCGHTFCEPCCTRLDACPTCRVHVQRGSAVRNYSLLHLLQQMCVAPRNKGVNSSSAQALKAEGGAGPSSTGG